MKALTIDFELVIQSMRDLHRESDDYYLNITNGRVVALSREVIRFLAQEARDAYAVLLPAWDASTIPVAREIVLAGSPNYVRIPESFGRPEHRWMMEFASTVRLEKIKQRLIQALKGRGSCFRFKEILKSHSQEMRRWHDFCLQKWHQKIQRWLESFGVLAIDDGLKKNKAIAQ